MAPLNNLFISFKSVFSTVDLFSFFSHQTCPPYKGTCRVGRPDLNSELSPQPQVGRNHKAVAFKSVAETLLLPRL